MIIKTSSADDIRPFIKKLFIPKPDSHKGQNGKILIIGGSDLFHAASLWSAEIASHFVDMVHFASTEINNEILVSLKKVFRNGIIVDRSQIQDYISEDDAVLLGPGLDRSDTSKNLTQEILTRFYDKQFILDAGSLQMMDIEWLKALKKKAIITPHQKEYEGMFNVQISKWTNEQKADHVKKTADEYNCIILLKAVVDIISDGNEVYIVEGGNQGLTKGGTGDILAGLTTAFSAKTDPLTSAVLASYVLKRTAEQLSLKKGYWYNNTDIIDSIPSILNGLKDL